MSPLSADGTNFLSKRLALLTLAHVLGTVGYVLIIAMAPVIRTEIDLNAIQAGSFMSAFYLALTVSALPAGTMIDHIGVGWVLAISMVLLALGASAFALADEYLLAVVSTFVMGLGYGLVNPATAKGVLEWFEPTRRATAMGIKQTGVPIGGLLASACAAAVVVISWRMVLLMISEGTITLGIIWLRFKEVSKDRIARRSSSILADIRTATFNRGVATMIGAGIAFNAVQQSVVT